MINLLPPEMKKELRAAHTNVALRKYLATSLVSLLTVVLVFGSALYMNHASYENHKAQLAESEASLADLKNVRAETKKYNSNLSSARQIYANEVKLSTTIEQLSSLLPSGSVLSNISLNVGQLKKPLVITAQVDTLEKAGVLKKNFEESGLFSKVSLKDVIGSTAGSAAYPFTANLEVTLKPKNKKTSSGVAP